MILTLPPLRQRLVRPGRRPLLPRHQRGFIMAPYRYATGGGDPYFASVVLLVDASAESNGSTPSGIDVIGKTPTWSGNAQCKTDQYKFGSSSIYLDGTNDRLSFADSADWTFGTGDFTIECWCRPEGTYSGGERVLFCNAATFGGFYSFRMIRATIDAAKGAVTNGTSSYEGSASSSTWTSDAWNHIAMSRVGNEFYACFNGTTHTFRSGAVTLMDSTGAFTVGAYANADGTLHWKGWIDQIRVTKGVGRYGGGSYTVPTGPFPHS